MSSFSLAHRDGLVWDGVWIETINNGFNCYQRAYTSLGHNARHAVCHRILYAITIGLLLIECGRVHDRPVAY